MKSLKKMLAVLVAEILVGTMGAMQVSAKHRNKYDDDYDRGI